MTKDALRILMIAPTPYFADRGCHVRIYEEARALTRLGHEVCIVTYHLGRDMPGVRVVRIPHVPWYHKLSAGPSWHKLYLDLLLLYKTIRTVYRFKPHILHAHLHEGAFISLLPSKMFKIPLVFDCQGSLTGELLDHHFISKRSLLYRMFYLLEKMINTSADMVISSSKAGLERLVSEWRVPYAQVYSIIDGINMDETKPLPRDEARRKLNLDQDLKIAVFVGLLNNYQGIDILLEAVALLKKAGELLHFMIVGFPEKEYLEKARLAGVDDYITFTGKVAYADVPLYLSVADIALSPKISLTEANLKLFSYMACGLPCVVFDTPVNREILGDGGIYAKYGDVTDFTEKICSIINDSPRKAILSAQMMRDAEEIHSWSIRGADLENLYQQVLHNK